MKTIHLASLIFLAFFAYPFAASASQEWDDGVKTYDIADFTRIELEGGYKVILEQSDRPSLRIKADEESFKYIDVSSDDGTLSIELRENHFNFESMTLCIEFVKLDELEVEGGVKLETKGYLDLNDFYLTVEGGAKIEMEIKVDQLEVVGEGGVSFEFRGVAQRMNARISGAGHLVADNLKTKTVYVEIEGVGGGSVYATDYLNVKIEGVGKIRYKGDPKIDKSIDGIGFVSPD